jgi:hypothetical protein
MRGIAEVAARPPNSTQWEEGSLPQNFKNRKEEMPVACDYQLHMG